MRIFKKIFKKIANGEALIYSVLEVIIFVYFMLFSNFAKAEKYNPTHYEIAWQVMHAVDVMQTLEIQDHPELKEGVIHKIIGRQPDDDNVYAWGIASAIGHYYLYRWIDDNTKWGKAARRVDLFFTVGVVAHNHEMGIRVSF